MIGKCQWLPGVLSLRIWCQCRQIPGSLPFTTPGSLCSHVVTVLTVTFCWDWKWAKALNVTRGFGANPRFCNRQMPLSDRQLIDNHFHMSGEAGNSAWAIWILFCYSWHDICWYMKGDLLWYSHVWYSHTWHERGDSEQWNNNEWYSILDMLDASDVLHHTWSWHTKLE